MVSGRWRVGGRRLDKVASPSPFTPHRRFWDNVSLWPRPPLLHEAGEKKSVLFAPAASNGFLREIWARTIYARVCATRSHLPRVLPHAVQPHLDRSL